MFAVFYDILGEEPGKAVKRARSSLDLDKLMNAKSSHHWCNEEVLF